LRAEDWSVQQIRGRSRDVDGEREAVVEKPHLSTLFVRQIAIVVPELEARGWRAQANRGFGAGGMHSLWIVHSSGGAAASP
jgi:hypothetical protein